MEVETANTKVYTNSIRQKLVLPKVAEQNMIMGRELAACAYYKRFTIVINDLHCGHYKCITIVNYALPVSVYYGHKGMLKSEAYFMTLVV